MRQHDSRPSAAWLRPLLLGLLFPAGPLFSAEEPPLPAPVEQIELDEQVEPVELDQKPEHPLRPAIRLARASHQSITENIRDYTCTIIRRERMKGKLGTYQLLRAKIRHEEKQDDELVHPFSVYLRFTQPSEVKGREALFVAGRNSGKVFVRRGGQRQSYLSSYLRPDSRLMMKENRYPITDIGFKRLAERLIQGMEQDSQHEESEVTFFSNAKIGDRNCTRVEVVHPIQRDHFSFHRSMTFYDDEDKMPIAYASYYWPRVPGGKPRLLEEYIYTNIKLNVGLAAKDFDRKNPEYGFSRSEKNGTE